MPVPDRPIEGVVTEAVPADAFVGAPPQSAPADRPLADWHREFVLFTPALLYTHGGLDRDLVQEYVNTTPGEIPVAQFRCPRPVFAGLGEWDNVLLATPRECWDGLRRHLATAEILDRARALYYRTFQFSLAVADPGLTAPRDPVPTVEVIVFGLDGNTRRVTVSPAARLGVDPARVHVGPALPATTAHGLRLLAGDRTPPPADPATAAVFDALAEQPPPT